METLRRKAGKRIKNKKHNSSRDIALIQAYQNGDDEALFQLIEDYMDIFSIIYRRPHATPRIKKEKRKYVFHYSDHDKQDLFMTIVVNFLELIREYDPKISSFESMVRGKLHLRVYKEFFEKIFDEQKRSEKSPEFEKVLETIGNEFSSIFLDEEPNDKKLLQLYKGFNSLTTKQKKVLNFAFQKNYTNKEIAKELGVTERAVERTKQRAIKRLSECINLTEVV